VSNQPIAVQDLELTVLEQLDFDDTPKCDNDSCDRDATHMIRCHCGVGAEFTCFPCVEEMKNAEPGNDVIWFDPAKSCGHLTLISLCEITPL